VIKSSIIKYRSSHGRNILNCKRNIKEKNVHEIRKVNKKSLVDDRKTGMFEAFIYKHA